MAPRFRQRSAPVRRRGLRPPPAVGVRPRRARPWHRRVAFPEGLEHAALRAAAHAGLHDRQRHRQRPHAEHRPGRRLRQLRHDATPRERRLRRTVTMAETNGNGGTQDDLRDRPIGDLLKQLSEQTTTLVRQELELAKAEVSEKGKKAGTGAGMFGGAGVSALLGLGALTAAAITLLDNAMSTPLAALIVGVVWFAIAGVLALQGRNKVQEAVPPVPEQATESVKEDVQWAKTRAQSARR